MGWHYLCNWVSWINFSTEFTVFKHTGNNFVLVWNIYMCIYIFFKLNSDHNHSINLEFRPKRSFSSNSNLSWAMLGHSGHKKRRWESWVSFIIVFKFHNLKKNLFFIGFIKGLSTQTWSCTIYWTTCSSLKEPYSVLWILNCLFLIWRTLMPLFPVTSQLSITDFSCLFKLFKYYNPKLRFCVVLWQVFWEGNYKT